jgi:hypothetical protein
MNNQKTPVPGEKSRTNSAFATAVTDESKVLGSERITQGRRKRSRARREQDIIEVAAMYVRGKSLGEITRYIAENRPYTLSTTMISNDIKVIRSRWLASSMMDFNDAKAKELAKIDLLESTYWEAWTNSLRNKETNVVETITDKTGEKQTHAYSRTKGKRLVEGSEGNVQFLLGVERCVILRCKILGTFAATKVDINWREEAVAAGADPDRVLNGLVNEFVDAAKKGVSITPPADSDNG